MAKTFAWRSRWVWIVPLLVAAIAAGAAAHVYLNRGPSTPAAMASYLPDKGGTVLYMDVGAMRKAGIVGMIAGSKAVQDSDYRAFLQQTGFDYSRDLDTLAGTFRGDQLFLVLRGRFDWDKLRAYAVSQHGSCRNNYCTMDGSQPQRRISFYKLRSNLMALSAGPDDMAAYQVTRNASHVNPFTPEAPVWVLVPAAVLRETDSLPAGLRAFALPLQNADRIVFSIGPDSNRLRVSADVTCRTPEDASTLLVELENTTNLLRRLLTRQHEKPNPQDLSGVLVSGTFRRDNRQVYGEWPIPRGFVDAIAGAAH